MNSCNLLCSYHGISIWLNPRHSNISTSWLVAPQSSRLYVFTVLWEGHKFLRNLHYRFVLCSNGQIFHKISWPSKNIWSLLDSINYKASCSLDPNTNSEKKSWISILSKFIYFCYSCDEYDRNLISNLSCSPNSTTNSEFSWIF